MTIRFAALLCLAATAAQAQQLDVPFEITEDTEIAGCLGSRVEGLNPDGDGFLAVRTGPGSNYPKIDELHEGDAVRPCARRGQWWGIYYGSPRRVGWVHGNWLGPMAG